MAHRLLDAAWDKYRGLMPHLPALGRMAERAARDMFRRDNAVLQTGEDKIRARLILCVGQFDDNAFTAPLARRCFCKVSPCTPQSARFPGWLTPLTLKWPATKDGWRSVRRARKRYSRAFSPISIRPD